MSATARVPEKLCVFCEHYHWEEPYEYSEYTAGGGYFSCYASHHEANWSTGDTLEKYREAITTAETCKDYKQIVIHRKEPE